MGIRIKLSKDELDGLIKQMQLCQSELEVANKDMTNAAKVIKEETGSSADSACKAAKKLQNEITNQMNEGLAILYAVEKYFNETYTIIYDRTQKLPEVDVPVITNKDGSISVDNKSLEDKIVNDSKLKSYQGSSDKDFEGNDYSKDYNVVKGFDPDYVQQQPKDSSFCPQYATAIAASIVNNKKMSPGSYNKWNEQGLYEWPGTTLISSENTTLQQRYQTIYNQVSKGNPIVMCVQYGGDTHYVTVVGLKKNADYNNLNLDDFLVADPGDAKVKSANQIYLGQKSGNNDQMVLSDKPTFHVIKGTL